VTSHHKIHTFSVRLNKEDNSAPRVIADDI